MLLVLAKLSCSTDNDGKDETPNETEVTTSLVVPLPSGYTSLEGMNLVDPIEKAVKTFVGYDKIARALNDPQVSDVCEIYFMGSATSQDKTYYYFRSSYNHSGSTPPVMGLVQNSDDPLVLEGKSASGKDQMSISLKEEGNLSSMTHSKIKWFHRDHYDAFACYGLVESSSVIGSNKDNDHDHGDHDDHDDHDNHDHDDHDDHDHD